MKNFMSSFKSSAAELKNVRCLTLTGILIAVFILLDIYSFNPTEYIRINFAFIAIASVGMFFGPVPAAMAALAGDFIGCILSGKAPILPLSVTAVMSGLLYGSLLYKKSGMKLIICSIIARVIDSAVICLVFQTAILIRYNFMSPAKENLYLRYGKLSTELVFFIPLIMILLPEVQRLYQRIFRRSTGL